MTIERELLDLLCCPVTRQPLTVLEAKQLAKINQQIERGAVRSSDGQAIAQPLEAGYITQDGQTVYRVEDGVIVLLPSARIPAVQFEAMSS